MGRNERTSAGSLFVFPYLLRTRSPLAAWRGLARPAGSSVPSPASLGSLHPAPSLASPAHRSQPRTVGMPRRHGRVRVISDSSACHPCAEPPRPGASSPLAGCLCLLRLCRAPQAAAAEPVLSVQPW